jgi:HlyD family secretion protein
MQKYHMKRSLKLGLACAAFAALILTSLLWYTERAAKRGVITVYGNVDVRQVDLGFRVFGRVTQLFHEEGDWIQTGMLLATMEKKPYTDQLTEAKASLAATEASFENEAIMLRRRLELIDSKSVSQEDLDTVMANYRVLKANLLQAQAAVAVAQKNVLDTDIFAPTDGTILTRIREPGSVVAQGEPVYTLSIASPVWIRAFISERDLGIVYPGMPAEIHTDTPGGKVYMGTVGFISPVSEFTPKTVETTQLRTDLVYRIRVYADNPDLGLRQGMPVTVRLLKNGTPTLDQSATPPPAIETSDAAVVQIPESSDPSDASKPRASIDRKLGQYSNIGQSAIVERLELSRSRGDQNFREFALGCVT